MTAPALSVGPVLSICAEVCQLACPQCGAVAGVPCVLGSCGTTGHHVARFAAAYRAGVISAPDFTMVTDVAVVFCAATIVFGDAR